MREIKFRAWDIKNRKMINADSLIIRLDPYLVRATKNDKLFIRITDQEGGYDIKDFYLMQYVGLKDCKGKEIYEGDIIKIDIGGGLELYTINWDNEDASFKAFSKTGEYRFISHPTTIVVGNIYENKDLLDVSK